MKIKDPNDYVLVGFEKSHLHAKKYNALLRNTKNHAMKRVPFGASSYEHYQDTTGLGLWSHKDHKDKERRRLYRARHNGEEKHKFSSGYFSWKYLW